MIEFVIKKIKTSIAQNTSLFDISTENVTVKTKENIISFDGVTGERTFSGAKDGVASAGCLNDTHVFENGKVTTECFFGKNETQHDLTSHVVNVGQAFNRDNAVTAVTDTKLGNTIIVYAVSCVAENPKDKESISADMMTNVRYTIGVLFKLRGKDLGLSGSVINCLSCDKLFINSVITAGKDETSLVRFEQVIDRFYAGDDYVVDYEFSYLESIFMDEDFKKSLQNWDANFTGVSGS